MRTICDIFNPRSDCRCLDYHIQKCAAPCVGYETEAHYDSTIRQITALLNGKTSELEALLTGEMQRLATEKQFEEHKEKMNAEDVELVAQALKEAKEAHADENHDVESLKEKTNALTQAAMKIGVAPMPF